MNEHLHHLAKTSSLLLLPIGAPQRTHLWVAFGLILQGFLGFVVTKMNSHVLLLCSIVLSGSLISLVHAETSSEDVSALNVMYTSLNSPSKLSGWKLSGGDPCGDSWKGIECSGSSVTKIKLTGLGLTGSLGYQLSNLKSVTYLDVSKNKLKNDIPYQLPPNLEHLDLSQNSFANNVPYSISMMSDLNYLNLGHNKLNGGLTDMFMNLSKLSQMDLSFNQLTGDLPKSLGDLKSLKKLNLQNNQFTGSINVLAKLSKLDDLNVENNNFNGRIPNELEGISNLQTKGNSFSGSTRHRKEGKITEDGSKSGLSGIAIGGIVAGVMVTIIIVVSVISKRYSSSHLIDDDKTSGRTTTPLTTPGVSGELRSASRKQFRTNYSIVKELNDVKSTNPSPFPETKSLQRCSSDDPRSSVSDILPLSSDIEVAKSLDESRSDSIHPATYNLAELQTATGNFAPGRLLGEGTIGRVYRAKYANGKVLAVKKIDSALCQGMQPEEFSEIIASIAMLKHPNVAHLVGYCTEQGHNMLVYEYFRNGSLYEFLHLSDDFSKPLTWNTRVKIALDTARAIEYLHEGCSPSIVHKNIKSSNVFLDMELKPHLSDCGLAKFHQRTSQNLGVGYNAPECTMPSAYTPKSDVYSFGVVMLELLTGRQPFDGSKPKPEQCLVRWATPQLHDLDALQKMVDPALRGLYPPQSVSRFADIISLCVQTEPEFRTSISEVVQSLVRLVQSQE